jgi:hypothetical protein
MSKPSWKSAGVPGRILLGAFLTLPGCASPALSGDDPADDLSPEGDFSIGGGGHLQAPSDPCQGVTCSGHGACRASDGAARCLCMDGFEASGAACVPVAPGASGCLPGSADYSQQGPYGSATLEGPVGSTVFYPARWQEGCLHPIAAWGNGTGVVGTSVYAHLNEHVASWGTVVIASPNPVAGTGVDLMMGLDWLLEQNEAPASPFFHRLSQRAGVAGHSQGGIGAAAAATLHPNVAAVVNVQGGGVGFGRASLLITGDVDFMNPSIQVSWALSNGPTFMAGLESTDHIVVPSILGAATPQGIQVKRLYAAWYRCFLSDDASACALFSGGEICGLCGEPGWFDLRSKNF